MPLIRKEEKKLARSFKRICDIGTSLGALIVLAPLLLLLFVVVKMDGGAAVFGHKRVGREGKPFKCYKFRSMVPDAEVVLRSVLDNDPVKAEEWRARQKLSDDPRITGVGKFLRLSNFDELPQFWNVLKGEMSIIGPRPVTEEEIRRYGDAAAYYMSVRPGITGYWQVSNHEGMSYDERVALDKWYVENWSIWLDIKILFRTFIMIVELQDI